MRLATLRDESRDGEPVVIDHSATRYLSARGIAPHLQGLLDDWWRAEPALRELERRLALEDGAALPLADRHLEAPLPRAYEWIDGSAYLNHVVLVRKARGAEPPLGLERDPLVYQGGSGTFLGPHAALSLPDPSWGLDFEAEIAVVLGDTPRGVRAHEAAAHVRLVVLLNDVTYRNLVPAELAKGFGFFNSKPSTAFAPYAVTPDELGARFRHGRVFVQLCSTYNGVRIGDLATGPEMHFSFFELIEHVTKTRALTAGTVLGSGTVSNQDPKGGVSCLAEQRARETIDGGTPTTPYMQPGDAIRIEAFDEHGWSPFGAIEQRVNSV
ncbi:MAG TPA: fumarylacetoacetate hydrolase family protein [Polyangiaceae bacterium]|nr:fumarylacetoacetate hydrolase family protein [Polyangiaceae bacterium]